MEQVDSVITGIGGFIAGHLARALADRGESVVGLARRQPHPVVFDDGVRFVLGDISDPKQMHELFRRLKPRTVFHLAAHSVLTGSSAAEMLAVNVSGTVNVLEACRAAGIPACVVASSDKQYGALAAPPYEDNDSTVFLNGGVYELSKAQQDQTARLWAGMYETPSVRVARLVNVYGAGDVHWTRIIPGTIRRTLQEEAPRITAGKAGEALREYILVSDAVLALLALAQDAHAVGNAAYSATEGKLAHVAFNIGGGSRLSAPHVIETVQSVLSDDFGVPGITPLVQPASSGVFEPGSQFSSVDKIVALFAKQGKAYAPSLLRDGLRTTIPWYLDHLRPR